MTPPQPAENLSEVFRFLGQQAGMEPEPVGVASMAHAIRKQMAAVGAASPDEFCRRLAADHSLLDQLLEELLVPETWFFRDSLAFQSLARRLADRRWLHSDAIRVLSIACSTGEEVYSLAIALREAGLAPPQYSILGVDLSRKALASACAGSYVARSFRESEESLSAWRDRWCERVGDAWQVRDGLRDGVEFRWANLSQPDFLVGEPAFHVIFCRNVLIYLHAEARRTAVDHVRRLLRPAGLIWSAAAEASIFAASGFRGLGGECPFAFGFHECSGTLRAETHPRQRRKTPTPLGNPAARPTRLASSGADLSRQPAFAIERRAVDPPVPALAASAIAGRVSRGEMLQAAQAAADEGRLEAADVICSRILAEDITCADAHCLCGVVRQAQGRFHDAERSFEKALYLDPRHYRSLVHVKLLAQQRGDLSAAANYRRRIDEIAPGEKG